ncbi:hypothetical protein [Holospora curviuscula]|nr:hypothetical protein [Holospora curviuscula]
MGANHCRINHDLLRISIYLPHTGFGPSYQPFVNPRSFPVRFWQCTPHCTLVGNPYRYQYVMNSLLSQAKFLLFLPIGRLVSLVILNLTTLNYKCRQTLRFRALDKRFLEYEGCVLADNAQDGLSALKNLLVFFLLKLSNIKSLL